MAYATLVGGSWPRPNTAHGETISRREARARARTSALRVGCALALAGGIGLALAFAAL